MGFSFAEMWATMGVPAKIVGGLLLAMGLASLTVFIERVLAYRRAHAASREFAAWAADKMHPRLVDAVVVEAAKHPRSHLARLVRSGLATYWRALRSPDGTGLSAVEATRRHVERTLEELSADLRRGLAVLASVGSVAPFVGLLGTVLGIISAFQGIASTGSGGLSSVAAGISEALIETALGLGVAIPAVLAFNYLSTRVAADELALATASGELVDTVEGWGEEREAAAGERPNGREAHRELVA